MMARNPFAQSFCVMVPEFIGFFGSKIFFLIGVAVFFHLFYYMLGLMIILDFKICRRFYHFMRMPALGTEFPFLEMIHIRKRPA